MPALPKARRLTVLVTAATSIVALAAAPAAASQTSGGGASTDPAHAALAQMSTDEKIGQLFETYAYGSSATDVTPAEAAANQSLYGVSTPAEVVAKYHLGAIIYFAWTDSLQNPTQMANLSNGLQQAATDNGDAPLLISTDQEGGNVTRIGQPPFAVTPTTCRARPASSFAP